MKYYVTMGQDHVHRINGNLVHKDVVVRFEVESAEAGRKKAFDYFGDKFCFSYSEKEWDEESMVYFPSGYLDLK